ncbi:Serine/threonine protein phosphatase alpha-1 isoform, putative [Trichomonas vaginalis G3]|uniref:Serine/threonine-protein phosphatase n=1 Tax=Trichomonas vaginalis (strain ATCC PRA-98 / G3) TaxID=412133 RepID=A2DHX2_TRIV3|nr:protein phosphatase 2A family, catalytic domain family [Trichomonas vaginalis G3]EAY19961.1 Serine/threonine protein phosphatase alpha-1 isoform, putative [Trichomonas vaginalis G3]KAI5525911.1 protein phosphatase 2A family, catalytic domain family [Trichomonas vaginalis G3]|eukprot:XP_001580947.1 Serine/threonine protein phosphatase alpha-1 isoform [Trichomonas vaginalis G3]
MSELDMNAIDDIIKRLLAVKDKPLGTSAGLTIEEINMLCANVKKIFLDQPILLELQPPLTIVGDIHGQYHDLLRIFDKNKDPSVTNYLFMGDYVDRGVNSLETICLLFAYKLKRPENFFLLRGNHECSYINREFGFYDECVERYNIELWRTFCDVFNCLPLVAIIEDRIFCVHGGISPFLDNLDQIREYEHQRPFDIPEEGLICDLVWSDPDIETEDWGANDRGASYVFGIPPLEKFLKKFNFDLVVRGHQAVMSGYNFPFDSQQGIVTVFSAPNYCYEYENRGATMQVDEELSCSFTVFPPINYDEDYFMGPRPGTPPRGTEENSTNELHL